MPDRGSVITRCANWRGGTYLFGAPQNEHVSPPTYLSKGLVRAAARASRVLQGRSPANARAANTRDMDDAQAAAPEVAPEATPVEVPVDARPPLHPKRRRRKLDEPGSGDPPRCYRFAKFRSAVPSRTAEPTYLFGALVVVVKCDLPTYPDGATGDNGPPIRQGAGTLALILERGVKVYACTSSCVSSRVTALQV